jgi:hypothetical protein
LDKKEIMEIGERWLKYYENEFSSSFDYALNVDFVNSLEYCLEEEDNV